MDNNNLQKLLEQLHDEINNTKMVDDKGSELLKDLEEDIRSLLIRTKDHYEDLNPSIIHRLQDSIYHFQVDHPTLTNIISEILETLSGAGI